MWCNAAECESRIITFIDPVMVAEAQKLKNFRDQMSPLPDNSNMPVHTAEVLRQVSNSSIPRGG